MFSRQHRKARVLFGLSDILLTALAFEAAYQTRTLLHLDRVFFLDVPKKALVLGFSLAASVSIGLWLRVYDKLDSGDPFYKAKLATARFYFAKLLPETASTIRAARAGSKTLMDYDEALF